MSRRQLERPARPEGPHGDDTGCTVLHVDMDAFFASVEILRRPELAGTPVIVGGTGPRSVVSAANYPAREYGVHSAMPMSVARRLCPHATVVPPGHDRYGPVSARVMQILESVTPLVEPLSLDEAFLDVAGARRLLGRPVRIAERIRTAVRDQEGLACSVGVATTKYLAKLASSLAKPDGLLVVPADGVIAFLHPLPVGALWGVGEQAERRLVRLGLRTVGDLAHAPERLLRSELGDAAGGRLHALAWGRDERRVQPRTVDKSIGAERTFETDIAEPGTVRRELLALAERVGARLRATAQVGRTVTVKLRRPDFTTVTRSRTLPEHTDVAHDIHTVACELYAGAGVSGAPLRLVGVRVEGLAPAAGVTRQPALDEPEAGWRELERAVDSAADRFGTGAVRPATLFGRRPRRGSDGDR